MNPSFFLRKPPVFFISLLCIALFFQGHAQAESLLELLGPENVSEETAYRYSQAKIEWFNYDLARSHPYKEYFENLGIKIPHEGLEVQAEEALLDYYAYGIPNSQKELEAKIYYDSLKTKKLYADRYGGLGNYDNDGSGRAAIVDDYFSVKGMGITKLHRKEKKASPRSLRKIIEAWITSHIHNTGAMSLHNESEWPVLWGEIMKSDHLVGANRTLMVISTGMYYTFMGRHYPSAIVVRENSIRPAHYLSVRYRRSQPKLRTTEQARLQKLHQKLFPGINETSSANEKASIVLQVFTRLAKIFAKGVASAYARNIFHSCLSPANSEISGRFLDFGLVGSIPGHAHVRPAYEVELRRNRTTDDITNELVLELINDFRQFMTNENRVALPDRGSIRGIVDKEYAYQLNREFLYLAGFPESLIDKLNSVYADKLVPFGETLRKIAESGNETVQVFYIKKLKNHSPFSIPDILATLYRLYSKTGSYGFDLDHMNKDQLSAYDEIRKILPHKYLADELRDHLVTLIPLIEEWSNATSRTINQTLKFFTECCKIRNKPLQYLENKYEPLYFNWKRLIEPVFGQQSFDDKIKLKLSHNQRSLPYREKDTLILSERINYELGLRLRLVVDTHLKEYTEVLLPEDFPPLQSITLDGNTIQLEKTQQTRESQRVYRIESHMAIETVQEITYEGVKKDLHVKGNLIIDSKAPDKLPCHRRIAAVIVETVQKTYQVR